ncbi:MAG: sulfotransferase [Planctomycetales bacterium]|nr:sulfotransferase [Planctomycetales bacterium]
MTIRHSPRNSYANFQDPWGLFRRMLSRGGPVARWKLVESGLELAARPLDAVLSRLEARLVRDEQPASHPILLVVGPPRSGTTVASQLIANELDVTYFSNLCNIFERAPLTASRLFTPRNIRSRRRLQNFYGSTRGLAGISDGFAIWNRWFGSDRYQVALPMTQSSQREMRCFLRSWVQHFDRPLLNKNNRNVDAIDSLAAILPEAHFLVVRRDPYFIAQSLIHARQFIQGNKNIGWGLYASTDSSSPNSSDPLAHVDDVCRQVMAIEARLDDQLQRLDANRFDTIDYATLCATPSSVLREICLRVEGLRFRDPTADELPPLETRDQNTLPPAESERARLLLGQRSFGSHHAMERSP